MKSRHAAHIAVQPKRCPRIPGATSWGRPQLLEAHMLSRISSAVLRVVVVAAVLLVAPGARADCSSQYLINYPGQCENGSGWDQQYYYWCKDLESATK